MSLKNDLTSLLVNAEKLCHECNDGKELETQLVQLRQRLEQPLRIAVVGIMKAGKSTFMNALMGKKVVFTGDVETTYTVCWFRYGAKPGLTVCFRDGTEEKAAYEDLARWSVRAYEKENPRINDVKYLIIQYPAEILRTMEFIDTPGLNSVYQQDAQNTLDFLAIQGEKETVREAGMADAVIYAFSKTAGEFDQKVLESFHGKGGNQASPINSLGILTKTDGTGIWQVYDDITPVEKARAVSSKVMENAQMKKLLFTALPVCAKACEGWKNLDQQDIKALERLKKLDQEDLKDYLSDAKTFTTCEEDYYAPLGPSKDRKRLMDQLGQYGILQAAELMRQGTGLQEMGAEMEKLCGIAAVKQLIRTHFGSRTFLIKSRYIFSQLGTAIYTIRKGNPSPRLEAVCQQILEQIDRLQMSVQKLKELQVLQLYYGGTLRFMNPQEEREFLEIAGEYGPGPEKRLGAEEGSTVEQLADMALKKANAWHAREASGWMMPGTYVQAAAAMARSCEQMYYHLHALLEE